MGRYIYFAVPLLLVVGCSGGGSSSTSAPTSSTAPPAATASATSILGKWKVDPEFAATAQKGASPGFMTGFSATFTYDYKADKTFAGSMTSGTYTIDGADLTMLTTKLNGQDVAKMGGGLHGATMKGVLSADGSTLTLQLPPENLSMVPEGLKHGIKMIHDK